MKKTGTVSALVCLTIIVGLFTYMGICVITGALGKLFVEFGVVALLEKVLRPLMQPLFNLPGVASLGAVMTFLPDNPAIITLSKDKRLPPYPQRPARRQCNSSLHGYWDVLERFPQHTRPCWTPSVTVN